jgi:hypothetical protein
MEQKQLNEKKKRWGKHTIGRADWLELRWESAVLDLLNVRIQDHSVDLKGVQHKRT